MEKKYMKPEMVVLEIVSHNLMQAGSPHNVTVKPNETVENPGLFESKGRKDDHESDGWSDDGLW